MNGRAIPGARFRLTNVIPERIIFVSRSITVCLFLYLFISIYYMFISQAVRWTEKVVILLLARPDTLHCCRAPTLEIALRRWPCVSCELEQVVR